MPFKGWPPTSEVDLHVGTDVAGGEQRLGAGRATSRPPLSTSRFHVERLDCTPRLASSILLSRVQDRQIAKLAASAPH
jgi:hypothetical protein